LANYFGSMGAEFGSSDAVFRCGNDFKGADKNVLTSWAGIIVASQRLGLGG
jgi:hypothetical protein